jgi:hypothetical protein
MPRSKAADDGLVAVYPIRNVMRDVPHVSQRVTPERATEMTGWMAGTCFSLDPDHPDRYPDPRLPEPPDEEAASDAESASTTEEPAAPDTQEV